MKVKREKTAHKAWSTWGIALLTTMAWARVDLMPWIEPYIKPDTYSMLIGAVGIVVFVLRFIDQGLKNHE